MPADPTFHNAIRAAGATIRQIRDTPEWVWHPSGFDANTFGIFHNGEWAGELTLRPGHHLQRADVLDHLTAYLNQPD